MDRLGFEDSTLDWFIFSEETCCPMKQWRRGHPLSLIFEDVDKIKKISPHLPLREVIEESKFEILDRVLDFNVDTPECIRDLAEKLHSVIKKS